MFALIRDILEAVRYAENFVTLRGVEFVRSGNGDFIYSTGNNAVVFQIERGGKCYAMRCYRRPKQYLRELYHENYYPKELRVGGLYAERFVDVVLCEWVEGESLMKVVKSCDQEQMHRLALAFDRLAVSLICAEWAHGDLAPENIIVGRDGELHLIDLDARYIPELEGCESFELGTPAYKSPHRKSCDFHSRIDDFSIVIISTSLHALALEPMLYDEYSAYDGMLLDGERLLECDYELRDRLLELFARNGYFIQYRALKMLSISRVKIDGLPELLCKRELLTVNLELFVNWGLCGYCDVDSGEVGIPPLYDEAFEFRGDYALVRLSQWWFYIDKSGCAIEACGEWRSGKPPKIRVGS